MIQRVVLGLIGGALMALAVFTTGNSVAINSDALKSGSAWVVFIAGAIVALFAIVGVRTLIGFGAGAAAAVAATGIIDAARAGHFTVTARLILLVVGVVAALAATMGPRSKRVIVEPAPVVAAPVAAAPAKPVVVAPVVVAAAPAKPVVVEPAPVAVKSEKRLFPARRRVAAATTDSAGNETTVEETSSGKVREVRATP